MSEETIPQMREQIDSLAKQVKELTQSNTGLVTDNRILAAKDVFRNEGLPPTHAELFVLKNPEGEATKEAVAAFVEEYGLLSSVSVASGEVPSGEAPGADAPGSEGLANLARGGSGSGEGGVEGAAGQTMTRQEWQNLYAQDPSAAKQAYLQGQVRTSADTPVPAGTNPYDNSETPS